MNGYILYIQPQRRIRNGPTSCSAELISSVPGGEKWCNALVSPPSEWSMNIVFPTSIIHPFSHTKHGSQRAGIHILKASDGNNNLNRGKRLGVQIPSIIFTHLAKSITNIHWAPGHYCTIIQWKQDPPAILPPTAAAAPIFRPTSNPTGPPMAVPKAAPASGYMACFNLAACHQRKKWVFQCREHSNRMRCFDRPSPSMWFLGLCFQKLSPHSPQSDRSPFAGPEMENE